MAVNVSAIIVTPQTRVFTLKKNQYQKLNQGSSNAQKKYILKHTHTHTEEDRSYYNPPSNFLPIKNHQGVWVVFSLFLVTGLD